MILRPRQRDHVHAIGQSEEAGFLAVHEFFHHDLVAAVAEAAFKHKVYGFFHFAFAGGNDHAFARRQPIGLDHHGKTQRRGVCLRRARFAEALIGGGGNALFDAKVFDEPFGAFQHGGGLARPQRLDPSFLQHIPQPAHQLGIGGDDGEINAGLHRKFLQAVKIGGRDRDNFCDIGDSGIAGGDIKPGQQRAFGQRPGQRMFAAPRSHQ